MGRALELLALGLMVLVLIIAAGSLVIAATLPIARLRARRARPHDDSGTAPN